jgi:hypothetical protein
VLIEGAEMAITIDRTARDALYEEVLTELTGSGDVWAEMQAGDYDAARPHARPAAGRHAAVGRHRLGARPWPDQQIYLGGEGAMQFLAEWADARD